MRAPVTGLGIPAMPRVLTGIVGSSDFPVGENPGELAGQPSRNVGKSGLFETLCGMKFEPLFERNCAVNGAGA